MFGKMRIPPLASAGSQVGKRQFVEDDNGRLIWFWYTREGVIIKWSLFFAFVLFVGLYLVLGRIHAKRRMRRGMKPMAYHAWLLSRQERAGVDPRYAWPQASYTNYQQPPPPGGGAGGYYGMQNNMPPPPVYDGNRPPMYEGVTPPPAGTKADGEYAPPMGPPPPAATRQ
ncbi:hypothetical protein F5B20DRAFT_550877 [Whalleya microplaca]|nr:hypothetical protein F5B20DRAFT_550877 [Whalleya microplaca]